MFRTNKNNNTLTGEKEVIGLGILYLSLHNKLRQSYGENSIISIKELFSSIGRHFLLKKNLRPIVLKELECLNMIKRINREYIQILELNYDFDTDVNKFYRHVGLF